jgi:hypothetical protein
LGEFSNVISVVENIKSLIKHTKDMEIETARNIKFMKKA